MTLQLQRHKITVKEYHKMAEVGILKPTDRVELIGGEIITMSPINNPHIGIINILNRMFIQQLGDQATISIQNPLQIDKENEPEPDIVVAKFRKDGYSKKRINPKDTYLIIEVADSSLKYDRSVKTKLYASANIKEYWIVNVKKQQIEQYTNPTGEKYSTKKIIKLTQVITSKQVDFSIKVKELFH